MDISRSQQNNKIFRGILNNVVWIILILFIVVCTFSVKGFSNPKNYANILDHSVFIGILAIAECFVLITNHMDLSVESIAAFSAIFSAWMCAQSPAASGLMANPFLTLMIVMIIGALIGLINGFFIVKLKINAFLVTLSTYIIFRGLGVLLTGGKGIAGLSYSFRAITLIRLFGIPLMVYLMIILYIVFYFVLEHTPFGRHIFIIGGNETAAYNFGININKLIYQVFILSGVLSAIAGWLIAAKSNGAAASVANGYLFDVIAAVVIGGVSLSGGFGSLIGVFAGVLLLAVISNTLNILAISPFMTQVIRGLFVLFAIVLDSFKKLLK